MDLREAISPPETGQRPRHPWELARARVVQDLLASHLDFEGDPQSILDLGCGDAWLLRWLAAAQPQHRFLAVDTAFTDEQLSQLRQATQGTSLQFYDRLPAAEQAQSAEPVQVVLLLDVIEHIADDVAFLRGLLTSPLITPQTAFLITVPAFQGLFCAHDEFLLHHRRYHRSSLRNALGDAGLQVTQGGYFFSSLLGPRVIQVALERSSLYRPKPTGVGQWQGSPQATRWLTQALLTDYRLGKRLRRWGLSLPGLSNFAIAYPHADT